MFASPSLEKPKLFKSIGLSEEYYLENYEGRGYKFFSECPLG